MPIRPKTKAAIKQRKANPTNIGLPSVAVIMRNKVPRTPIIRLESDTLSIVLTVSSFLNGEFGLNDVCLSVPSIVSDRGIERIIDHKLSDEEHESLRHSASVLQNAIESLDKVNI